MAHAYNANIGKTERFESTLGYIVRCRTGWATEKDFASDGKAKRRGEGRGGERNET